MNDTSAVEAFLNRLRREGSASAATLSALAGDLAILMRYLEKHSMRELSSAHIRTFAAREHQRGMAPVSIQRMLSSWRRFFADLADQGKIDVNPVIGVRAPRGARRLPKDMTPDETVRLLEHAPNKDDQLRIRDLALFETAYSSALRVSELVGLDCADVDTATMLLNVRHGKGNRQRYVPFGSKALGSLRLWQQVRASWGIPGSGAVFTNRRGGRLTVRSVQLRMKKICREAGLSGNVTPHVLRHSCASHLLQSSGDLRGVQEFLGHASVSSTQVYTHLDFQALSRVYEDAHPRARRKKDNKAI